VYQTRRLLFTPST